MPALTVKALILILQRAKQSAQTNSTDSAQCLEKSQLSASNGTAFSRFPYRRPSFQKPHFEIHSHHYSNRQAGAEVPLCFHASQQQKEGLTMKKASPLLRQHGWGIRSTNISQKNKQKKEAKWLAKKVLEQLFNKIYQASFLLPTYTQTQPSINNKFQPHSWLHFSISNLISL